MLACEECFSKPAFKRRFREERPALSTGKCSFHSQRKGIPVDALARLIDPVFRENYVGGPPDPFASRGSDLRDTLWDLTGVDDDRVAEAISEQLVEQDNYWPPDGEEPFYDRDYRYHRVSSYSNEHGRLWGEFRYSLMHDQRFFNSVGKQLIETIFQDVHLQRDQNRNGPIYVVRPGDNLSAFYRARIANEENLREQIRADPGKHLGAPPERLRRAGRLNAAGISTFYGAFDFDTCIAELRPSVGSVVLGAKFQITSDVCVFDTTRFGERPKEPNPFARGAVKRAAQWRFMKKFMNEIAMPISPQDEHLDYVPTQAVAEYLVHHHLAKLSGGVKRKIDAIIYRSAQRPAGKNIALLGAAATTTWNQETEFRRPKFSFADDLLELGLTAEAEVESARISPLPNTLKQHVVTGVSFSSSPHSEFDDLEDEDDD